MGEPSRDISRIRYGWTRPELKYLSKVGKEINRDSESSDERNWNSLNSISAKDRSVAYRELYDVSPQNLDSDTFIQLQENDLERSAIVGNSPVSEITCMIGTIHS
jgi:hypothetical protein